MAFVIESPPRVFGADARPTLLHDIGLEENEAQWVVDESRTIVPHDASSGRPITVRFTGDDFEDRTPEWAAYYEPRTAEIICGIRGENMGVIVHELAHGLGLDHETPGALGVPQWEVLIRRMLYNKPFRDAHARLIDFWEDRLGLTRLNEEMVNERPQSSTDEVEAAVEKLNRL
jgi:hypothetical protein